MPSDFKTLLWILKIGAGVNVYLVASLLALSNPNPQVVVPGLILLGVSGFRCLYPNRYLENIVFHDSPLSSIFLTRCLATFSEVAYIYQFSYVIRFFQRRTRWLGRQPFLGDGGASRNFTGVRLGRHSDQATRSLFLRGTRVVGYLFRQHGSERVPVSRAQFAQGQ